MLLKNKIRIRIGITLFIIALVIVLVYRSGSQNNTVDKPSDKYDAYAMAQSFVKDKLKAPATADFPNIKEAKVYADPHMVDVNGYYNTWEVTSYVDAQNSFGALIRSNFYVKIEYIPTKEEWKLLDIKIY